MTDDGSAGFMMTVLPVTIAAETMPREDCDREIPRRNHEGDATRPVMLVAFFAEHVLGQFRPAHKAHLLGVEEAKIHRLANVAIGFLPGLAHFVDFHGRELETPPLHDGRDPIE